VSGAQDAIAIFDAVAEIGRRDALRYEGRQIVLNISQIESTCGACQFWMLDACPREVLQSNGRKKGPSMNEPKCGLFEIKPLDAKYIAKQRARLDEIAAALRMPR